MSFKDTVTSFPDTVNGISLKCPCSNFCISFSFCSSGCSFNVLGRSVLATLVSTTMLLLLLSNAVLMSLLICSAKSPTLICTSAVLSVSKIGLIVGSNLTAFSFYHLIFQQHALTLAHFVVLLFLTFLVTH